MTATLLTGDCLEHLQALPDASVRCCVTSPPYWGLRDYGVDGQLGLEKTPDEYVEKMVAVFRGVRRVLTDDGTLWLNLGDSYASIGGAHGARLDNQTGVGAKRLHLEGGGDKEARIPPSGLKPKDLVGIPWRVAFALQADGWYLRSDIIWAKPNPMPESVTDRPTKSHEYLFLLAKSEQYHFDAAAIAEPVTDSTIARVSQPNIEGQAGSPVPFKTNGNMKAVVKKSGNVARKLGDERGRPGSHLGGSIPWEGSTRNARSVWTIATTPYPEAHFATFPEELARRCIVAGSAPGDTVLDPFSGSGTVAAVAVGNGRAAIGIELNPAYQDMARRRIGPMFVTDNRLTVEVEG